MSKQKKGINIDSQKIIAWCKSNLVLVILIVVSVGAIVGLPQLGGSWKEKVEESLRERATSFKKLETLTKTPVPLPGGEGAEQVAINAALVKEYGAVTESLREDAEQVVQQAIEMNQKEYKVLFTEAPNDLFPDPTKSKMETLPQQFFQQLQSEYTSLLQSVRAGTGTSQEDLAKYLEDERVRYMEINLSTKHDVDLTEEQYAGLKKNLSKLRLSFIRRNAEGFGLYLKESALDIPEYDHKEQPTIETLFGWQWRYWVIADTLGAIASINGEQTVLTAPVKRVVFMNVIGLPSMEDEFDEDEEDSGRGGGRGGSGGGGGRGGSGGGPLGGPIGGPLGGPSGGGKGGSGGNSGGNSGRPPKDTAVQPTSFTGRASGGLFDIVKVRLRCIVDTQRIPEILNGYAKYNFSTVVDLDLRPIDKFDALANGYDYGPASVSELTIVLETVWLRSWTTEFMPNTVKDELSIPYDK